MGSGLLGVFLLDHRLVAADELARAGLLDLDLLPADLANVHFSALGHRLSSYVKMRPQSGPGPLAVGKIHYIENGGRVKRLGSPESGRTQGKVRFKVAGGTYTTTTLAPGTTPLPKTGLKPGKTYCRSVMAVDNGTSIRNSAWPADHRFATS
jgi:hypothetical protein